MTSAVTNIIPHQKLLLRSINKVGMLTSMSRMLYYLLLIKIRYIWKDKCMHGGIYCLSLINFKAKFFKLLTLRELYVCFHFWSIFELSLKVPNKCEIYLVMLQGRFGVSQGFTKRCVYLGWPITPSYISPNAGGPYGAFLNGLYHNDELADFFSANVCASQCRKKVWKVSPQHDRIRGIFV